MNEQEIAELHRAMLGNYKIGQKVRALKALGDEPSGDAPGGTFAYPGEILIVRKISPDIKVFPISVSHEHITDRSFSVAANEIEVADE